MENNRSVPVLIGVALISLIAGIIIGIVVSQEKTVHPGIELPAAPRAQPPSGPDRREVIYPSSADVDGCTDAGGKLYPATGPGAAHWFIWNRCAREKFYSVYPGEEIILHIYTDNCADCVCTYPKFCVSELRGGTWEKTYCFDKGIMAGSQAYERYRPGSDRIRISAERCFYLEVLRSK